MVGDLQQLDLNLLHVFRAVMATGHLSRAAERLHLSQSAMSHALGRLRDALGDKLFLKSAKGMIPTAVALRLAPGIDEALDNLERLLTGAATFTPALTRATVRVATTDYTELLLWPRLANHLRKVAPSLVLLTTGLRQRIPLEDLESGAIDLAVGNFAKPPGSLRMLSLFDDTFTCLMRKGHPLSKGKLTPELYAQAGHLLVAPWGVARGNVDEALEGMGLERRIAMTVGHFASAPEVIATSDLVTTLPTRMADVWTKRFALVAVQPPVRIPGFRISLLWHERTHDFAPVRFVRDSVQELVKHEI